jgi:hypothetical protein
VNLSDRIAIRLPPWLRPELTRWRVALALLIAISADAIQIFLGPLGWPFADEFIDVVTMVATSLLVGFHVLLLPTFVIEFIPVVGMLPTWTGCMVAVVAMRRRHIADPQKADSREAGPSGPA